MAILIYLHFVRQQLFLLGSNSSVHQNIAADEELPQKWSWFPTFPKSYNKTNKIFKIYVKIVAS